MKGKKILAYVMTALLTVTTLSNDYLLAKAAETEENAAVTESVDTVSGTGLNETDVSGSDGGALSLSTVRENIGGDLENDSATGGYEESEPGTDGDINGEETETLSEDDAETGSEDDESIDEEADDDETPDIDEGESQETEYPEFEKTTIQVADLGLTVSVQADEGTFPEGTTVSVNASTIARETENAIKNQIPDDKEIEEYYCVNISFIYKGEEIEPAEGKKVSVSFASNDLKGNDVRIFHINDEDASDVELMGAQTDAGETITISSGEFSDYVVATLSSQDAGAAGSKTTQMTTESGYITSDSYITIAGQTVTSATVNTETLTIKDGDPVKVKLCWKIPNTDDGINAGDSFYYDFPKGIIFSMASGDNVRDLTVNGTKVGTVTLTNQNTDTADQFTRMTIQYTDMDFVKQGDINGQFDLSGTISLKKIITQADEKVTFSFPGIGDVKTIVEAAGAVNVEISQLKDSGQNVNGFLLMITSTGTNNNVKINNKIGSSLKYTGSASGVTLYSDSKCATKSTLTAKDVSITADGLSLTIDKMTDGQTVYIKYSAEFIDDIAKIKDGGEDGRKDVLSAGSDEMGTKTSVASSIVDFENKTVIEKTVSDPVYKDAAYTEASVTWTVKITAYSTTNTDPSGKVRLTLKDSISKDGGSLLNIESSINTSGGGLTRVQADSWKKIVITPSSTWTIRKENSSDETTKTVEWTPSTVSGETAARGYSTSADLILDQGATYIITYDTTVASIPDNGGVNIINKATAITGVQTSASATATLGKYASGYNDRGVIDKTNKGGTNAKYGAGQDVTWNIQLKFPEGIKMNDEGAVIEDWYDMVEEGDSISDATERKYGKLKLEDYTITVSDLWPNGCVVANSCKALDASYYTLTEATGSDIIRSDGKCKLFTLTFTREGVAAIQGKLVNIQYTTSVSSEKNTNILFRNWTALNYGDYNWQWSDYEDIYYRAAGLTIDSDTTRSDNAGNLGWKITTSGIKAGSKNVIADLLPSNNTYLSGSLKIYDTKGNEYTGFAESSVISDITDTGFNINVTDEMITWAGSNDLVFGFQTQIATDRLSNINAKNNPLYTDKATLSVDGKDNATVYASQNASLVKVIEKSSEYDSGREINYTVNVNPDGLKLIADGEGLKYLKLVDTMGAALTLKSGSVRVNGTSLRKLAEGEVGYGYYVNESGREVTFYLEDAKAQTLTYTGLIAAERIGENLGNDGGNCIVLSGARYTGFESKILLTGNTSEWSASTSGIYKSVRVEKRSEEPAAGATAGELLDGAKFSLYKNSYIQDSEGNITIEKSTLLFDNLVTGSSGNLGTLDINFLRTDLIYSLVETEAPDGYVLDPTPYYFVFVGHNGVTYPDTIAADGKTYSLDKRGTDDAIVIINSKDTPGDPPTVNPPSDPPTVNPPTITPPTVITTVSETSVTTTYPLAAVNGVLGASRGIEADDASVLGARRTAEQAVLGARRSPDTSDPDDASTYWMLMCLTAGIGAAYALKRKKEDEEL